MTILTPGGLEADDRMLDPQTSKSSASLSRRADHVGTLATNRPGGCGTGISIDDQR